MNYSEGKIGRIFVIKFDDRDIVTDNIIKFARKEKVSTAAIVFLGAMRKGTLVCGPKKPVMPPLPHKIKFKDAWEGVGFGTIFSGKDGPQIHLHAAMGQKKNALTGCIREKSEVFGVIEAIVFELKGVKATKAVDPKTGINLLRILQ